MSDTLHDGALQDLLAAGHDLYALRGGERDPDVDARRRPARRRSSAACAR